MTELCLREDRDGVALLTLNRPDRLNAWCSELEDAYFTHLLDCEDDGDVRAIVVTGAGRGFCAGADMDLLAGVGSDAAPDTPPLGRLRPVHYPLTLRTPLIAAINGAALGGGSRAVPVWVMLGLLVFIAGAVLWGTVAILFSALRSDRRG